MRMDTDPKSIVLAMFDRLNKHDLDGYYDLFAEDIVYTGANESRGIAAARATNEPFFESVPDHWRRVDRLLVAGDTVAVWLTFGGTPRATGVPYEVEVCSVIEVRDGKVQSTRMYTDWKALISKLSP